MNRDTFLRRPILGGRVNFPLSLAPMVGMSHVGLRAVVRHYTPADATTIWPTEMLSSWRLPNEDLGSTDETRIEPGEDLLVPQILGNAEKPVGDSVRALDRWGVSGVDVNMGCPVRKALKHNYGVALMGDPDYAAEVVRYGVKASGLPVSVKLRAGLQNDTDFLVRFTRGLEDAGASWITLHPRVGHLKRRGAADWPQVRTVRDALNIPVIGNGDVQCADDVEMLAEVSGCDAIMVGRALAARPWLMWQIGERLGFAPPAAREGERAPATQLEEGAEYERALLFMIDVLERHFAWEGLSKRVRFHVRMTAGWLEWGQALFAAVSKAKDVSQLRAAVRSCFLGPHRMSPRTALRE